jgi:very-short-patch-repair endonuclease
MQGIKSENNNSFARKALELRGFNGDWTKLWRSLKSKALDYKFKHQYLIGNYIVDFVCLSKNWLLLRRDFRFSRSCKCRKIESYYWKGFKIISFNKEDFKKYWWSFRCDHTRIRWKWSCYKEGWSFHHSSWHHIQVTFMTLAQNTNW